MSNKGALTTELSAIRVKTLVGDDLWDIKKKNAVIESFVTAIYQDEKDQAEKYRNKKGIDWEKYYDEKAKAGFTNQKRWKFVDSREVFVQIDSVWLKPEFGLTEEKISWSLRVENFFFHGSKVDIQLYAGSNYAINAEAKAKFKDRNEKSPDSLAWKWVNQIIKKYEPLGHGTNFQAKLEVESSDLIQILNDKIDFSLKNFTVIWTSHTFLFIIFHEMADFIE